VTQEFCYRYTSPSVATHQAKLVFTTSDLIEPVQEVVLRGRMVPNTVQQDVFENPTAEGVDILFVVDNSGSMQGEQSSLAANFSNFIAAADAQNIDYRIAVVTTQYGGTVTTDRSACHVGKTVEPGVFFGEPKVISRNANAAAQFACNIRVGTNGSAREAGLEAAWTALQPNRTSPFGTNANFLRANAKLSLIFVSDEEDQSPKTVAAYMDYFQSLKGVRNLHLFDAYAIVGDLPSGCSSVGGASATAGARYQSLVSLSGGVSRSICSPDWGRALADIGVMAVSARGTYPLTRAPLISSLKVYVDNKDGRGEVLRAGNTTLAVGDWSYNSQTNVVLFRANLPRPGSRVRVTYSLACPPSMTPAASISH